MRGGGRTFTSLWANRNPELVKAEMERMRETDPTAAKGVGLRQAALTSLTSGTALSVEEKKALKAEAKLIKSKDLPPDIQAK